MSVKPKDKILTYEQARELKWFCKNVSGVRQDMYEFIEMTTQFDDRIKRLERTCELIEKYFADHPDQDYDARNTENNEKETTNEQESYPLET